MGADIASFAASGNNQPKGNMRAFTRTEDPKTGNESLSHLKRLLPYIWVYRGRVLLAMGALILAKLATVAMPFVLKGIVDDLNRDTLEPMLIPVFLLAGYGVLRFASAGFTELRDILFIRVRYRAMQRLSVDVLNHLHHLSLRYHLTRNTGGISRDLQRASSSLGDAMNYLVFSIGPIGVELALVMGVLLTQYDINFTLLALAGIAVYMVFTVKMADWRVHHRLTMNRLDSEANGRAIDGLLNYETVKYFNTEAREKQQYDTRLGEWLESGVKAKVSMSMLNLGQNLIVTLSVTSMMFMAASQVSAGVITLGDFVLLNTMMLQLFIPLNFLGVVYRQIRYSFIDMNRVVDILESEPEVQDRQDAEPLQVAKGAITFDDVHFHYDPERPILKGINFNIEPGQKVAVVGPSGAGKSTLARLLFRFYELESGRIRIDNQDIAGCTQDSVRKAIGIVPQDTVLFNESLRYNLSYAREDATEAEILSAIELADLSDFIAQLPEGLDTVVGERGLKLSGGEKQRVAIARVILKQAPILLFDEATSSLDTQSEQQINQALARVARGTTTLVVAHRLSTIIDADQILVMEGGRIVERGTHQALLAQGQLYAKLWRLQLEKAKKEERD